VENSNALATMAGMTLVILTGEREITGPMARIQREFADCLPQLLG
jgi:hypothetical protein